MSGLILLVIVGAWLAVLVPMALRSHDHGRSLSTVDKFHDAMRVLSRRDNLAREPLAAPDGVDAQAEPGAVRPVTSVRRASAPLERRTAAPAPAPVLPPVRSGPTAAARRRRVLLVLAATAVVSLVAGLVGPRWLLAVHAVADLLVVAYVGHLRHQTVLRAEREWREALGERVPLRADGQRPVASRAAAATSRPTARPVVRPAARAAAPASVRYAAPGRVAGIPDRMPPRPAPLEVAPPAPARGAVGEPWNPVPVPLPGYVTAPTAPRRVVDLTGSSDGVSAAERELGIDDQGPELDEILERRRAAGGW